MPASLAHMLISRQVRNDLHALPPTPDSTRFNYFLQTVLDNNPAFMELGSLGPDLPYFRSLFKGLCSTILARTERPMGFDAWSYQLHSKDTSLFPLKMIEVTWKETNPNVYDWDDHDRMKLAFVCGFLTHVAADQVIHPIVNRIAGPYYKKLFARNAHRACEIHQDLYVLCKLHGNGTLPRADFNATKFHTWTGHTPEKLWSKKAEWFVYFLQKSFVETHAICPTEKEVRQWVRGISRTLKWLIHPPIPPRSFFPYEVAYDALFDDQGVPKTTSDSYRKYIELQTLNLRQTYDNYLSDAIELGKIYVRAAFKLYEAGEIDTEIRRRFRSVVQSADLGAPLDLNVLQTATAALSSWDAQGMSASTLVYSGARPSTNAGPSLPTDG